MEEAHEDGIVEVVLVDHFLLPGRLGVHAVREEHGPEPTRDRDLDREEHQGVRGEERAAKAEHVTDEFANRSPHVVANPRGCY